VVRGRWPIPVLAILLATSSRADEPDEALPVVCDEGGCAVLTFEEHARRLARGSPGAAADKAGWAPLATLEFVITTIAEKQPVEPDVAAPPHPNAPSLTTDELLRLLTGAPRAQDGAELRGPKTDVDRDAADATMRPALNAGAAPATDLDQRLPDDRGFLDVVLVGHSDAYHCTGIMVAPDAVLTAGHCLPATEIAVAYRTDARFAHVHTTGAVRHPDLDAAVLRLEHPLPLAVRARRHAPDDDAPIGALRMVGFGVDDVRHPSSFGVKRRVDATVTGWGCDRSRARSAGCRPDAELLLTAVGGGDTCFGDSGGPVLEAHDGAYRLVAITSRPTASGASLCGHGGIYVRVDVLDAWLNSNLEPHR